MTDQPPPGSFPPPPSSGFPPPPSGFPPPPPPGQGYGSPTPPGYSQYGVSVAPTAYAGIGARLGALLIDGIVVFLLFLPAIIAVTAGPTEIKTCSVDSQGNVTIGEEINSLCEVPTGGTWAAFGLLMAIAVVLTVLYHTLLVGRTGQTWGRRALNVRVVDSSTGGPIGNGRALGRYLFAAFISSNICLLGYLWALWDGRKQTWHDKVVSSVVVKA